MNIGGMAIDAAGNIYIADKANQRVRKIAASGIITTVAGKGTAGFSGDGGAATSAQLNQPAGVALDAAGNVYVLDSGNFRIRKIAANGTIATVAGNGNSNDSGDGGAAVNAGINPSAIAADAAGNLYLADGVTVRKVSAQGTISTMAGSGVVGYSGDGGPAWNAQWRSAWGIAVDAAGNIYLADGQAAAIRMIHQ
jgi:sugar lactone lactonase YvrE